jgi:hypothetical protein
MKLEFSHYACHKKLLRCRAVVRLCKNFLLRAVSGPGRCKKIRGNVGQFAIKLKTSIT